MLFPQSWLQQLFSFNYKAPSPPVKTVLSALSRGIIGANRLIVARFSNVYWYDIVDIQGTKIFKYCTCPAGQVTYNFHSSWKHMHLSFISICNKEHKGVICNMTSSSNSSQSTRPTGRVLGKNYSSFLDFTRNYERTSGIFVPWYFYCEAQSWLVFSEI